MASLPLSFRLLIMPILRIGGMIVAKLSKQENQPMTNKMKSRLNRIVAGVMLAIIGYIGVHLVGASIINSEFYRSHAAKQQLSTKDLYANRGAIYDTNGEILAKSATVWSVVIAPALIKQDQVFVEIAAIPEGKEQELANQLASLLEFNQPDDILESFRSEKRFATIKKDLSEAQTAKVKGFIEAGNSAVMLTKEATAKALSDILASDYQKVLERTYKNNQYEIVKRKVEKPEADQIRTLITESSFTFITLLEDTKRYYPNNELLSNVIGFTGSENQGVYGLEYQYEEILGGTNGKLLTATDGLGNPIPTSFEKKYDAIEGNSIVTTIDQNIQRYTENALSELIKLHKPEGGASAIVMDVSTGGVLAMASSKNYDPNHPSEIFSEALQQEFKQSDTSTEEKKSQVQATLRAKQWGNDTLNKLYEPGSVYKIVTAAAALESGNASPESTYNCTGVYVVEGERMRCNHREGHGTLDFKNAIVKSCNPAFIQIGLSMGTEVFNQFFNQFGMNEATGIDLPGEAKSSIYVPVNKMGTVELASSSFGQTMAVTPLQMITAVSTAVNGGYLVQPHVLKEVQDPNGNVIKTNQPGYRRQVISQETTDILKDALEAMVEQSPAYVKGYRIGGKSGTSQKGNNSNNGRYASFTAFAPADDPQIAVLVVADQPTGKTYYGSMVCGAAVASIMSETLAYMGITPQYTEQDLKEMNVAVPSVIGKNKQDAVAVLKDLGLNAQVYGEGDKVVGQMPNGASIASGSKVILYTEPDYEEQTVIVPDVMGISPTEANKRLTDAGLTVSPDGNVAQGGEVTVIYQSHEAGTEVSRGAPIAIKYGVTVRDD